MERCNHDDNKQHLWLEVFDYLGYEIYMCECGVLINIHDIKNYENPIYPMNKNDIEQMMTDITHPIIKAIEFSTTELNQVHKHLYNLHGA